VPPDLVECTVEKVAINAVMAGCPPSTCRWCWPRRGRLHRRVQHARPAGHHHAGGTGGDRERPDPPRIGMNSASTPRPGQPGQRTIGRALQLVIRNVGGGRPGEVDRATLGNPGKLGFCFAEDEEGSPWTPLRSTGGPTPRRRRRHPVRRRGPPAHRRPALARPREPGAHVRRLPAHRRTTRSCRWRSTPSLVVSPSTPGCSRGRLGPARADRGARRAAPAARRGDRARRRAASPRACPSRLRGRTCRSSATAAAGRATPAAAPACSLPSSAAGPTAPWGASP
jgi:hypothetical protein